MALRPVLDGLCRVQVLDFDELHPLDELVGVQQMARIMPELAYSR